MARRRLERLSSLDAASAELAMARRRLELRHLQRICVVSGDAEASPAQTARLDFG